MKNGNIFIKILAIAGTVLTWLPILAPIFFSAALFFSRPGAPFLFDYLMPAELFLLVLVGGGLLLAAAFWARRRRGLIAGNLGGAVLLLAGCQGLAEVTGLANGRVQPGGWQWALVLGMLIGYILAVILLGVGGILLLRDLFKSKIDVTLHPQKDGGKSVTHDSEVL